MPGFSTLLFEAGFAFHDSRMSVFSILLWGAGVTGCNRIWLSNLQGLEPYIAQASLNFTV